MKCAWISYSLFLLGAYCMVYATSVSEDQVVPFNDELHFEPGLDMTTVETTTHRNPDNGTKSTYPQYLGFITAGVAVIVYGSVFVPVKNFETGDGMFFQWIMCAGIWLSGMVLQIVLHSKFYPLVMVGGVIWATGNICVVPIIKALGMGLGMCIWGMFNLLGGWASGRFGLFGIKAEVPNHVILNYVGVALAMASSIIYVFVKNEVSDSSMQFEIQVDDDRNPLTGHITGLYRIDPDEDTLIVKKKRSSSVNSSRSVRDSDNHIFVDDLSPNWKRIVGVTLSVFSGIMYGINFSPAIHVQDNVKGASQNSLDYVFAEYCGIFLTGSFYFILYIIVKKNKPRVYPKVILPGLVSGVMWGIATACWFIANKALSEPVAFPIITTGPGALASLFWGVCIFKEIKGKRNILILLLAFSVTTAGAVLAGVSKG